MNKREDRPAPPHRAGRVGRGVGSHDLVGDRTGLPARAGESDHAAQMWSATERSRTARTIQIPVP